MLVVEDVARLRELLVSAIAEMGYGASGTPSAEDAIEIMERDAHDIVLLDLNLPGMDGLDFFEILSRRWSTAAVIILTAFGDMEAAQRAIRLDVVDFLTKPLSLGDLEIALDRAYRRRPRSTGSRPGTIAPESDQHHDAADDSPRPLRELEREHVLAALKRNNGNRAATAAELGISVRTLYYRLVEYQREGESNADE